MKTEIMQNTIYACAPMDGITDYVFRQVQARMFMPADRYYTPFLSLTQGHGFQKKESNELLPEHNRGLNVIPQLIGNRTEDFLWGIDEILDLGYEEVNLNLGCPSKVVVKKKKGAGMLGDPAMVGRLLDDIFSKRTVRVSVKTRIGLHSREEFPEILEIFNRFPLEQLIIHARFSDQNYGGDVHRASWEYALAHSVNPLCYNGDLFRCSDVEAFIAGADCTLNEGPYAEKKVMIGRGLIANPAMIGTCKGGPELDAESFRRFHDELFEEKKRKLGNEQYLLECMKEFWNYFRCVFSDSGDCVKEIRRSCTVDAYENALRRLIDTCRITEDPGYTV